MEKVSDFIHVASPDMSNQNPKSINESWPYTQEWLIESPCTFSFLPNDQSETFTTWSYPNSKVNNYMGLE